MRLLVVEDDVKLAAAVARGLRFEGHAVDVAGDADEALWHAGEWSYEVIVLDLMLPGRDGFEVTRLLRARDCWTPVLMLTARGGIDDRVVGLDAGADDYLLKPFDFDELLARLRALSRRVPVARPTMLRAGRLQLDPALRTVTLDGDPLELTVREHAVLEALLRRRGQVVPRAELLAAVWDAEFDGSTNVVDVYVSRLRRKVGEEYIRTVRGVGFVLEIPE